MTRRLPWDGASFTSKAMASFNFSVGSADADLESSREVLEYRSRALFNNAPFAGAAVETKCINVVGTGLKCRPRLNDKILGITREEAKQYESEISDLFEMWAVDKECDAERENNFYQLQDLALKTQLICGDAFGLRCFRKVPSSPFGICFKLLEGNRCQNPLGKSPSNLLAMGVEVDANGAVTAYHFTKEPNYNVGKFSKCTETVRVPAFDRFGYRNVVHVYSQDRPNQRRGVPWLAPVIVLMKKQEQYLDSELIGALVRSMFTVFVKHGGEQSIVNPFMGNADPAQRVSKEQPVEKTDEETGIVTSDARNTVVEMAAGNIVDLGENEEIQVAERHSSNETYGVFIDSVFTEIAARLGISMEMVMKKFSTNYNAVRAAILESWKMFNKARMNLAIDFCQPIYDAFLDECVLLGLLKLPGYDDVLKRKAWHRCSWVGDAPVMLDPEKETRALKMQLDEQLTTRRAVVTQINGCIYDDVAVELSEEKALRQKLNLDTPGAVSKTESTSTQKVEDE